MEVIVISKLISALFAIVVLQGMVNVSAAAQTGNNCAVGRKYFFGEPRLAGSYGCSGYPGTYQYVCLVQTSSCSPFAAPQETCPRCPHGGGPISLATGNTFIDQVDVTLPGLSGGLTLRRTWNSAWPSTQAALQIGMFGPNWRSTFEERVFVGSDNYIKYARSDGSFWSFGVNMPTGSDWAVAAPANVAATLEQGTSFWTLTFLNGEKREFDNTTGNLIAIIDRNGNTTQLTYDTSNRLVTVADPASRHLNFTYASSSSNLVTGVTSDVGALSLSYAYDAQGRLSQITKPDLTTVTFAYNTQSLITTVTDSNGKVLESHTYDSSGRGLTSSRANGVEALTITYQ
jgi:YD repeat-containing protein